MKGGRRTSKGRGESDALEDSENLTHLLVKFSGKWDTPALIAYLADERVRLLLCKAMVSPVSDADRQLAQRARKILRSRGMDPDELKAKLEPAAFALGLIGSCDFQIDYYDVLGIDHSATSSEVRSAYRKKAFEIHPDTAGNAAENSADFVTLKAAYDTLLDPKSRVAFDQCQEQFDSWHEEETEDRPDKKVKRPPSGKLRKACYRVGAVVMALVVMAWVINLLYERATMLELVEVTSSTAPGKALETTESADTGKVAREAPVVTREGEDKTTPKLVHATKTAEPEKVEPEKAVSEKPAQEKKLDLVPLKTAALAVPEPVEIERPVKAVKQVTSPPPVKKEKAAPVPEPVPAKALPIVVTEKKQASVVGDSLKKIPKELPKPIQKERVNEIPEAVKKNQPSYTAAWAPSKLSEKPAETPVQKFAIKPKASSTKPVVASSPAEKVQTVKSKTHIPAEVVAKAPVFSVDPTEEPIPPNPSLHTSKVTSQPTFPEISLPKTHETPFVKRSQILSFLKKYTAAYEKGNAETFFSYFMPNATENGKPLKTVQPDYLEIWEKVRSLDYRISLDETEQEVGSDTVSMKGRFDLGWVFLDGPSGKSRGAIAMDLKVNDDVLRVSRLDYRFDE